MAKPFLIEEKHLRNMMADSAFLAAVPCLSTAKQVVATSPKRCGRCMKKRNDRVQGAMAELRRCIARMDSGGRNALKRLLRADKIRIKHLNDRGQTITLTF